MMKKSKKEIFMVKKRTTSMKVMSQNQNRTTLTIVTAVTMAATKKQTEIILVQMLTDGNHLLAQHFLNFLPLPQGQLSFLSIFEL